MITALALTVIGIAISLAVLVVATPRRKPYVYEEPMEHMEPRRRTIIIDHYDELP